MRLVSPTLNTALQVLHGPSLKQVQQAWTKAWTEVGAQGAGENELEQLLGLYAQPHRHYHTAQHLAEMVSRFLEPENAPHTSAEVLLAIFFHDAIYEPQRHDNETRSADLAFELLAAAGADPVAAQKVAHLVRMTAHSVQPQTPAECFLVDLDLAILGAPAARFEQYEQQVRQEYAFVPAEIFTSKRREILRGFLERPVLYWTATVGEKLEAAARHNLTQALQK